MTKEELQKKLRQEAEENCVCTDFSMRKMFEIGYIAGAEPREKRLEELEKENAELSMKRKAERKIFQGIVEKKTDQLTKAKGIILRLYNAGRDVLMCRAEEKAYDNLSNAINDKSIEQFLSEGK